MLREHCTTASSCWLDCAARPKWPVHSGYVTLASSPKGSSPKVLYCNRKQTQQSHTQGIPFTLGGVWNLTSDVLNDGQFHSLV